MALHSVVGPCILEQLQDKEPFLKAFGFGGSFGSAVDEKNEK